MSGEVKMNPVKRMSKDLEITGKEGARVVCIHFHPAHEVYMTKIALSAVDNFYNQPDSSLWNADAGARNLY